MRAMSPAAAMPRGFRRIARRRACQRLTSAETGSWSSEAGAVARAIRRLPDAAWPGWPAPQVRRVALPSASLVADPWVQPRVRQIDDQVQRHEREGDQHDVGLHHGIVAEQNGLD